MSLPLNTFLCADKYPSIAYQKWFIELDNFKNQITDTNIKNYSFPSSLPSADDSVLVVDKEGNVAYKDYNQLNNVLSLLSQITLQDNSLILINSNSISTGKLTNSYIGNLGTNGIIAKFGATGLTDSYIRQTNGNIYIDTADLNIAYNQKIIFYDYTNAIGYNTSDAGLRLWSGSKFSLYFANKSCFFEDAQVTLNTNFYLTNFNKIKFNNDNIYISSYCDQIGMYFVANKFYLNDTSNQLATLDYATGLTLTTIQHNTNSNNILVSDGGIIKYRTSTEVRSDISAQPFDATLTALANLTITSDNLILCTGNDTFTVGKLTNSYIGNLGTNGIIAKFGATGLTDSYITQTSNGLSVINSDIYFQLKATDSTKSAYVFCQNDNNKSIELRQFGTAYSGKYAGINYADLGYLFATNTNALLIAHSGDCPIVFSTNALERARIDSNGIKSANYFYIGNTKVLSIDGTENFILNGGGNSGSNNLIAGYLAGTNNTGNTNVILGNRSGYNNLGNNCVIIGYQSGYYNQSSTAFYVGFRAGFNNTIGTNNFFFGNQSGYNNIDGGFNVYLGNSSAYYNNGSYNVAIGYQVMANAPTAMNNSVGIGARALFNAIGNNITAVGYYAGYSCIGSGSVFLGYCAGQYETNGNRLYIANSSTTTPLVYGEFDNNLLTVNGTLQVTTSLKLKSGSYYTTLQSATLSANKTFTLMADYPSDTLPVLCSNTGALTTGTITNSYIGNLGTNGIIAKFGATGLTDSYIRQTNGNIYIDTADLNIAYNQKIIFYDYTNAIGYNTSDAGLRLWSGSKFSLYFANKSCFFEDAQVTLNTNFYLTNFNKIKFNNDNIYISSYCDQIGMYFVANKFYLNDTSNQLATLDYATGLTLTTIQHNTNSNNILVSDGGIIKYRTSTEVRSDISAQPFDATLTALANLTITSDNLILCTGNDTFTVGKLTNSYIGNLGTNGIIAKFGATGLTDSYITQTSNGLSVINSDIYFQLKATDSTKSAYIYCQNDNNKYIQLRQMGTTYSGTYAGLNYADLGYIIANNTNALLIAHSGDCPIVFSTNALERARISSGGLKLTRGFFILSEKQSITVNANMDVTPTCSRIELNASTTGYTVTIKSIGTNIVEGTICYIYNLGSNVYVQLEGCNWGGYLGSYEGIVIVMTSSGYWCAMIEDWK